MFKSFKAPLRAALCLILLLCVSALPAAAENGLSVQIAGGWWQYAPPGGSLALTVEVTAPDPGSLSYQWYRLEETAQGLWVQIALEGECSAACVVSGVTAPTQFACVVTDRFGRSSACDCKVLPAWEDTPVASGTCGAAVKWRIVHRQMASGLSFPKLLIISGTGPMDDYAYDVWGGTNSAPWGSLIEADSGTTFAVVEEGVTSIGAGAFAHCGHIQNVVFPDTLELIGDGAFCGIHFGSLSPSTLSDAGISGGAPLLGPDGALTISGTVRTVGKDAFANGAVNANANGTVTLQGGVRSIGANAFYQFYGLTELSIPRSVTEIGENAFFRCEQLERVAWNSEGVCDGSGVSFGSGAFYGCAALRKLILSEDVRSLYETGLARSALLDSAGPIGSGCAVEYSWTREIPDRAFYRCEHLKTVLFADTLRRIGTEAFAWTGVRAADIPSGVTEIGERAFEQCRSLSSAVIPNSVAVFGGEAFANCPSLRKVWIGTEVGSAPDEFGHPFTGSQFDQTPVKTLILLYGGSSAIGLENVTDLFSCGDDWPSTVETLVIPSGIRHIYEYAFSRLPLRALYLPKSLRSISPRSIAFRPRPDIYYAGSATAWNMMTMFGPDETTPLFLAPVHFGEEEYRSSFEEPELLDPYYFGTNSRSSQRPGTISVRFDAGLYERADTRTELDIKWSPELFRESAFVPQNDLAIAALVLCSGAYNVGLGEEALLRMGFRDILAENYDGYDDINRVAFLMGHTKETINGRSTNLIAVALRGSVSLHQDWASNLLQQAQGFRFAADDVKADLLKYIEEHGIDTTLPTKLFITGHSRGAAAADLLAAQVSEIAPKGDVYVYTFACPNTTDAVDRKTYTNVYNILNGDDFVTGVPYIWTDSPKYGREIWFRPDLVTGFNSTFTTLTELQDPHYVLTHPLSWCQGTFGQLFMFPFRNHSLAVYMSYLLASGIYEGAYGGASLVRVSVRCPVDVFVYDSAGQLLGTIENNVPDDRLLANGIGCTVEGDEKRLYTTPGRELRLEFVGTDAGSMSYSVEELDCETGETIFEKTFSNVALEAGKTMSSAVGGDRETEDTRLFAKTAGEITEEIDTFGREREVVLLSFDTDLGTALRALPVTKGASAGELPEPQMDGYLFEGWYADPEFSEPFDPEAPLDSSMTVYAKYSEACDVFAELSRVSYDGTRVEAVLEYDYAHTDHTVFAALYQGETLLSSACAEARQDDAIVSVSLPAEKLFGLCQLRVFCLSDEGALIPLAPAADCVFYAT